MTARKLAEADAQIQTLRRHVAEECVAIASSGEVRPVQHRGSAGA